MIPGRCTDERLAEILTRWLSGEPMAKAFCDEFVAPFEARFQSLSPALKQQLEEEMDVVHTLLNAELYSPSSLVTRAGPQRIADAPRRAQTFVERFKTIEERLSGFLSAVQK